MNWRHTTWARWLGWTLTFALLFAGVMLAYAWRVPDNAVVPVLAIFAASFVLCPIAAFKIGVRFPSPRWPAGTTVAVLATLVAVLLMPAPSPPWQTALGMTTPMGELLFVLLWDGWLLLVALSVFYYLASSRADTPWPRHEGSSVSRYRVSMDIGGTFTDVVAYDEASGAYVAGKASTTPRNLTEGVFASYQPAESPYQREKPKLCCSAHLALGLPGLRNRLRDRTTNHRLKVGQCRRGSAGAIPISARMARAGIACQPAPDGLPQTGRPRWRGAVAAHGHGW